VSAYPRPYGALAVLVATCAATVGCAARGAPRPPTPFDFARDTFAFSNETVWEYHVDVAPGETSWRRRDPPPPFSLRCGNMARAARQFHLQARFDPALPAPDATVLAGLVAEVLRRDPREMRPAGDPVVIPGYVDLRSFSTANQGLVERALGGAWPSHLQRGNWRMIFPFPPGQQRAEADRVAAALRRGETPILHVLRFPALTLNHMILLFGMEETPEEIRFQAYDPNDASGPILVRWDRAARTFVYPRTPYFGGGPVKAYAIYDGLLS